MNFNAVLDLPREIQCCPGRHQRQFNAVRKAQGLVQCFPGLHRFKFRFNLDPFYTDRFIVVFEPKSFPDSAELSRFFFKFNVVKLKCVKLFLYKMFISKYRKSYSFTSRLPATNLVPSVSCVSQQFYN